MTEYIKFHPHHTDKILNGEKWMTVRYGWDRDTEAGEEVWLREGGNEGQGEFAKALITFTTTLTIEEFVEQDFDGHKKYSSPERMCELMQQFYPGADLTPQTEVTMIGFKVLGE